MNPKRVLFVDDEPYVLQGLENLLRKHRQRWEMVFALGSDAALAALRVGEHYAPQLDRLALESEWGRHLARQGRADDLEACLRLGSSRLVPIFEAGVILPGPNGAASSERRR